MENRRGQTGLEERSSGIEGLSAQAKKSFWCREHILQLSVFLFVLVLCINIYIFRNVIDELGGLDRAVDIAASLAGVTLPEVEEYSTPSSFIERLLGGISAPFELPFSGDELLFLRILDGWYGIPRY